MKKIFTLFIITALYIPCTKSQFTRFIVRLKDKNTNPFTLNNPSAYLTQRSINRRQRFNILIDSTDLPITPRYIDSIKNAGAITILNVSKWLNQVVIQTSDAAAITKINSFPFVISTGPIANSLVSPVNKQLEEGGNTPASPVSPQGMNDYYNYGASYGQVHLHNGEFLHNRGFRGEGMILCLLDAGFYHYLSLPTFDSVRNNGQILGTWDFVAGNASVDEDHAHGMNCLSTIAANMPGVFMGQAPKTSFYLYRTEDAFTEYPIEEQNWAAGAERADSLGVDVCSTSLGYTTFDNSIFNHSYADMNGKTTIIAKAHTLAASKGILLFAAAGNDGSGSWHYIGTPADADSIVSVGAVNNAGQVAGFSSYGPSSDGRIKPNMAAVGSNAVVANPGTGQPGFGSGTSFACPNLAGISTCLWQAFPELNNMSILDGMQRSSNRFSNPDDRSGYGIPDMKKAYVILFQKLFSKQATLTNCKTLLQWSSKSDTGTTFILERKLLTDLNYKIINTQLSSGNFIIRNFSYTDDLGSFSPGTVKYRISVKISADTSFYLDSVTINYLQTCTVAAPEQLLISPNPVRDQVTVKLTRNNPVALSILLQNSLGQKMYTGNMQQAAGTQIYYVNMRSMARGIYYITVFLDGNLEVVKKIVKL